MSDGAVGTEGYLGTTPTDWPNAFLPWTPALRIGLMQ